MRERLFELTRLRIEIHYATHEATLVLTLPREEMEMLSTTASELSPNEVQSAWSKREKLQV